MKTVFREFFNNEEVNFNELDEDILIVLDTNILLNIYRFSESTRNTFLEALNKVEENIWIPYQVGLEFHLHRREIMVEMQTKKDNITTEINTETDKYIKSIKTALDKYPIKSTDGTEIRKRITNEISEEIKKVIDNFNQSKVVELDNLINKNDDKIAELADLFEGKVGAPFSQEEIDAICSEGLNRYEEEIPPGYKDRTKKEITRYNNLKFEKKYGDLIAWKEMIKQAKDYNKKVVIFITGDVKPDWWYEIRGRKIGARAELKNEMLREAGADLILMDINHFLKETSNKVKLDLVETKNKEPEILRFNYTDRLNILRNSKIHFPKTTENKIEYIRRDLEILLKKVRETEEELYQLESMCKPKEEIVLLNEIKAIQKQLRNLHFKIIGAIEDINGDVSKDLYKELILKNSFYKQRYFSIRNKINDIPFSE